jgi:hypothetical protein
MAMSESQLKQNALEQEESRNIMNKRRKRMPLIEDYNLDEIFSERQKDQILNSKRQKIGSEFSCASTDYEERVNPREKGFIPSSFPMS